MSKEDFGDEDYPPDLGSQLVEIIYNNTKLNYDVCAYNLVEVFTHLSQKIPKIKILSDSIVHSIQVMTYNYAY